MDFNSKYKSSKIEEILDSVEGKQDELVSGTNIKTINDTSILGSGNIVISDGEDGATFTPSVDANGNLSWTNNKGLSNPPTVNIKGPKGDSGEGGGGVSQEYVDNAIANAITTTINASY